MAAYVENFYCGEYEYVIQFANGTHRIIDVDNYEHDLPFPVVFVGSYEQCKAKQAEMIADYQESLF